MKAINNLSSTEYRWFAVYTKYKAEKFVCEKLQSKRIQAYVPLISETKRYTRKVKTYLKPLINCYVFVKIKKEDYIKVLQTEHVMRFLKIKNDLIAIPDEEIQLMKRIVGEVNDFEINYDYLEGQKVEIISGNLTGIKGLLVKKESKHNFLIQLETIGVQMRITIDPALLKPIRLPMGVSI